MTGARDLWTCPRCGRTFANRNQTHTCGLRTIEEHFAGKPAEIRAIFDRFVKLAERNGPLTILPQKTRIALHARMSFAALKPRRAWVDGHVVLARRREDPRFRRIDSLSPRNHVHTFRIERVEEVDGEVADWLAEAYAVGMQHHRA
jgi:hypothetical protein